MLSTVSCRKSDGEVQYIGEEGIVFPVGGGSQDILMDVEGRSPQKIPIRQVLYP